MKKFLLLVVAIFISSTLILTGCGDKGLKDNPATNAPVVSNGGMAVLKGDYLYYVNGFKSYEGLEKDKDNVWGKQVIGSIYRVKVDANNTILHDEDGFLTKSEVVVPQIVGTENVCFYIFGDYIYYATPNMQNDKNGNLLNARSNMCRVNIDGTDNKVLYTTDTTLTSANWTMFELDGTVYMVVYDGTKIVGINANAKKPSATTMASNITSVGLIKTDKYLPTDAINNQTIEGVNNYVYYTRDIKEDDSFYGMSGNVLARVKLGTTEEEVVCANGSTFAIIEAKNDCLYYTKTNASTQNSMLCKYTLNASRAYNEVNETVISYATYSNTYILNKNNENYVGTDIVAVDSSNNIILISTVNGKTTTKTVYSATTTITPIGLYGSSLFFIENSKISYVDVTSAVPTVNIVETNDKTIKTDVATFFDFDGRNVYFYSAYTPEGGTDANYYLNRTDLHASDSKSEFVGVFAEGHVPAEPDEDSDEIWIQ